MKGVFEMPFQASRPFRAAPVIILATNRWPAHQAFARVVIHRNARVVDEQRQSVPVLRQTLQNFTARLTQLFDCQLGISLSSHGRHMLLQSEVGCNSLAGPRHVSQSFAIEAVQLTYSQQPCQSPVFQFRLTSHSFRLVNRLQQFSCLPSHI